MIAYRVLGGRFTSISPSSFTHVGSFARRSIPATDRYASGPERKIIERLGRQWGCHTCGNRKLSLFRKATASFVADHMPPKMVVKEIQRRQRWLQLLSFGKKKNFPYRFYPQCTACSNKQGSLLSSLRSQRNHVQLHRIQGNSCNHAFRFRPIPHAAGATVAGIAIIHTDKSDIDTENRYRYARIHERLLRRDN